MIVSDTRLCKRQTVALTDLQTVDFDPKNIAHRNAFRRMMVSGRQDTKLRFNLEGHRDVMTMMVFKMAVAGCGALDLVHGYEEPVNAKESPRMSLVSDKG